MIRFEAPEDFVVEEIPLYPPTGEGGHTFVRIEKRGRNTEEVARDLARAAGVAPRDVGYAGRKDRIAVATQWFSVPELAPERALGLELPGSRVLEAARHGHKLRTGHLRANRFDLRVREVAAESARRAAERLAELLERGLPNRFGSQRFGRDGRNPELGLRVLLGELAPRDRRRGRFWVSALQAAVFNDVLAARVESLDRVEAGDVAVVQASGGLFLVEDVAAEQPRAERFEISATGPIFGTRMRRAEGAAGERESSVLEAWGVPDPPRPPRGIQLRGTRRALRVRPEQASVEREADGLRIRCTLPPGSFATVLVEELLASPPG